jgi:hypothetical protein
VAGNLLPPDAAKDCRWKRAADGRYPGRKEHMSVTSVLSRLPPYYGPLSGNTAQSEKFTGLAEQLREKTPNQADGSQLSIQVNGAAQDIAVTKDGRNVAEAGYAGHTDVSQFQSTLAQALRANGAPAGRPSSGASGSDRSQSSIGAALYKRVSQMGNNNDPTTSALLRSWNSIMQSGQDAGHAGVATSQVYLQHEGPTLESSTLHVTA